MRSGKKRKRLIDWGQLSSCRECLLCRRYVNKEIKAKGSGHLYIKSDLHYQVKLH